MRQYIIIILTVILAVSCQKKEANLPPLGNDDIGKIITKVTEGMVHDVTNPPLAARFFAYICLSGYEVMALNDSSYQSMHGTLNEFPVITKPETENYSVSLSAILAMLETARKIQPSGSMIAAYEQQLLDSCSRLGYAEELIKNSQAYAENIS